MDRVAAVAVGGGQLVFLPAPGKVRVANAVRERKEERIARARRPLLLEEGGTGVQQFLHAAMLDAPRIGVEALRRPDLQSGALIIGKDDDLSTLSRCGTAFFGADVKRHGPAPTRADAARLAFSVFFSNEYTV